MGTYSNQCIGEECVYAPVGTGPACTTWHDCTATPKHYGCSGINCVKLDGSPPDLCSKNVQCGGVDCCEDSECPFGWMCEGGYPNPFGGCSTGSCVCRPSGSVLGFQLYVAPCHMACCSGSCTPSSCGFPPVPCSRTCN
jgi:hypothetical protein